MIYVRLFQNLFAGKEYFVIFTPSFAFFVKKLVQSQKNICQQDGFPRRRRQGPSQADEKRQRLYLLFRVPHGSLSVAYPGQSQPTLHNVSFVLHPWDKAAFVGDNSAGKTTLIKGIAKSQQERAEIERFPLGLYTNLKKGLLTQEDYIFLKSGYAQQSAALIPQIASLQEERINLDARESLQNEWLKRFKKYREIESLDRTLVTELIDRIDIYEGRRLTIHFKFQDEFEKIRAFAEQEQQALKQAV